MLWAGGCDLRWGEGRGVDGVQTSLTPEPESSCRGRVSEPEPLRTLASHHPLAGGSTGDHWPAPGVTGDHSLWPGVITRGQGDSPLHSPESPPLKLIVCIPSLERAEGEKREKKIYIYVNANDDNPQKINTQEYPESFMFCNFKETWQAINKAK